MLKSGEGKTKRIFIGRLAITSFLAVMFFAAPAAWATVSLETSVAENPYNKAAEQLQQKQISLAEYQLRLEQLNRELEQSRQRHDAALIGVASLFFALIALNYYLDYRRRRTGLAKQ